MKKVIIMTYKVPVDGLTGEEALVFVNKLKGETANVVQEIQEFLGKENIKVVEQWLPVFHSGPQFTIDIIEN